VLFGRTLWIYGRLHIPSVWSKAVDESTSAIPEHAAEDALEHFVEFEIVDGLRSNASVQQRRAQHPHVLTHDLYHLYCQVIQYTHLRNNTQDCNLYRDLVVNNSYRYREQLSICVN